MQSFIATLFCISLSLMGCRVAQVNFHSEKRYEATKLKEDLHILKGTLDAHHPGLFWYQSVEEWQKSFLLADASMNKPMTEPEFRKVLRPFVSSIRCGHTSVRNSKNWQKFADTLKPKQLFPISVKCWADTMLVLGNLDPADSLLVRGIQILSINGKKPGEIYEALFPYIFGDGYNTTHKYQVLSGWGTFGSYYRQFLDSGSVFQIEWMDLSGNLQRTARTLYTPTDDVSKKSVSPALTKKQKRNRRLESIRSLQIDPIEKQALMRINSFGKGGRLLPFFRNGFRLLRTNGIESLIIDVRNNGGGRVGYSTALTKYLADRPFKIADSLYAIRRNSNYGKYIRGNTAIQISMPFLTSKRKNGYYHLGFFERHRFSIKKKNHYKGDVYALTGGNSFSATTLFLNTIKGQKNVTILGEETGGGAYGNSAWEIPDIVLPNTGVRVRLPLFRMVMNKNGSNNGRGILPDISVGSTVESVRRNYDNKMQAATKLIQARRRKGS